MTDDRTYIKLHDGLPNHPKVRGLSDRAFRTLVAAWCHCSQYLTDGEVVTAVARDLGAPRVWAELVAADLAEPVPSGYLMHDYLEHQRSADEVRRLKKARAESGRRGGQAKAKALASARPVAKQTGKQTPSKVVAETETETETEEEHAVRGVSHVSRGAAEHPPSYPDRCTRHSATPEPGPCGDCADARKTSRARPLALVTPSRRCLVHDETFTTRCRGCEADRKATG